MHCGVIEVQLPVTHRKANQGGCTSTLVLQAVYTALLVVPILLNCVVLPLSQKPPHTMLGTSVRTGLGHSQCTGNACVQRVSPCLAVPCRTARQGPPRRGRVSRAQPGAPACSGSAPWLKAQVLMPFGTLSGLVSPAQAARSAPPYTSRRCATTYHPPRNTSCDPHALAMRSQWWPNAISTIPLTRNRYPCAEVATWAGESPSTSSGGSRAHSSGGRVGVAVQLEKPSFSSRKLMASIPVAAPMDIVWAALTDYEGLGNFIPSLAENRCLERRPNGARLYQVRLADGQAADGAGAMSTASALLDVGASAAMGHGVAREHLPWLAAALCGGSQACSGKSAASPHPP